MCAFGAKQEERMSYEKFCRYTYRWFHVEGINGVGDIPEAFFEAQWHTAGSTPESCAMAWLNKITQP